MASPCPLHRALIIAGIQLVIGILLVVRASLLTCFGWHSLRSALCPRCCARRNLKNPDDAASAAKAGETLIELQGQQETFLQRRRSRSETLINIMQHRGLINDKDTTERQSAFATTAKERKVHRDWAIANEKSADLSGNIFCNHVRSEENFIQGNDDFNLRWPPSSPMEIEAPYYTRLVLLSYWSYPHFVDIVMLSFGWAIVSGGLGTLVAYFYQEFPAADGDLTAVSYKKFIDLMKDHMGLLISDFKWLPTFMLTGHVTFFVQRWRQYIFAAWDAEGRLKDLGIIIGADVIDPSCPKARKLMFKFYRLMVLVMALQYRNMVAPLKDAAENGCLPMKLKDMGLLTEEEELVLVPAGSRMRDTVLSWIAREVQVNTARPGKPGLLYGKMSFQFLDKLTALRGKLMYFHGNSFYPQPNVWSAMMKMMVDMYCMLMIVGYPVKMLVPLDQSNMMTGLQPLTTVAVFLMTLCFWGAESIAYALAAPFVATVDTFNIDALIAGTEQTLFASLRASFDDEARGAIATLQEAPHRA